ncbi:hypothetical protein K470DRAFT_272965 [Piedraia hortae CBS 480.64]|uniref:Uncharacterized protein n=1 Tax=Piedraia hortae CBS 480.64 TaxID=1314780 RepID=A0A6A7BTK1_9PEZI|nr:hypothetical protein K470DRAFT_272965 [Piedraia hortae CBS 480.64]
MNQIGEVRTPEASQGFLPRRGVFPCDEITSSRGLGKCGLDPQDTARPSRTTPPSGIHLRSEVHSPHTPLEERAAAGFWPNTQPSDEEDSDSGDDHPGFASMGTKMELDSKDYDYTVDSSTGQTFSGRAKDLSAFLTHVQLKELLYSDLKNHRIKCAYAANQLRDPARD